MNCCLKGFFQKKDAQIVFVIILAIDKNTDFFYYIKKETKYMYTNEQTAQFVNETAREMEQHINTMEAELKKSEPNLAIIGLAAGKISKLYGTICAITGVFSGTDWRTGGLKDSSRYTRGLADRSPGGDKEIIEDGNK